MDNVVRCIAAGADDYLPKPFEPVLLQARIGACLDRKHLHDREVAYLESIKREKAKSEALLHAILPIQAINELQATGQVRPRRFEGVAVLFVDLMGFTSWCHTRSPEEVVATVERLAENFESFVGRHGMEKIKTIGDAFMATANLLEPHPDPVMAAVQCAYDIALAAARDSSSPWDIRAGVHLGTVVAGVVGRSKFSFDLWGDTVNVAARLSSFGADPAVYLSKEAFERIRGRYPAVCMDNVLLKGKGLVEVWRCEHEVLG